MLNSLYRDETANILDELDDLFRIGLTSYYQEFKKEM